ncbi:hypothetical protein D3C76_1015970 [compost metagenome]|jgi:hypothetical protein
MSRVVLIVGPPVVAELFRSINNTAVFQRALCLCDSNARPSQSRTKRRRQGRQQTWFRLTSSRSMATALNGYRVRLPANNLPVALPKNHAIIFAHCCFWFRHKRGASSNNAIDTPQILTSGVWRKILFVTTATALVSMKPDGTLSSSGSVI